VIAAATEVQLLIIDCLGMRKLPASAAEDLLEIVASSLQTGRSTTGHACLAILPP
jgi:hypothetical protein